MIMRNTHFSNNFDSKLTCIHRVIFKKCGRQGAKKRVDFKVNDILRKANNFHTHTDSYSENSDRRR